MSTNGKVLGIADLIRDEVLPVEKIFIEDWGGDVCIRVMSGTGRADLEKFFVGNNKKWDGVKIREEFFRRCICDENGNLILDAAGAKRLLERRASVTEKIFEKCLEANGFREQDVEGLAKN